MIARLLDVSKRYGRLWALARLSMEIEAGRTVLLTGENGAGKTTLLRTLATAVRPTFGAVELFGRPAWADVAAARRRVGLMTHPSYLYDALSGRENLALVGRLTRRGDAQRERQILEEVGLAEHAGRPVGGFSAGMKRRLCLARLLLLDPELILLDEPFGQLDPGGVELMERTIRRWRDAGKTLVVSTHDIERGLALCSVQLKLSAGRQIEAVTHA